MMWAKRWLYFLIVDVFLILALKYPDIISLSQWPYGLKCESVAARMLGLRVRIPPWAWMNICCECCVLSGRGLCVGASTRPEESYRVCLSECYREASVRKPWPTGACFGTEERITSCTHILLWTTPSRNISRQDVQIIAAFTTLPFFKCRGVLTSWFFWHWRSGERLIFLLIYVFSKCC
jgi:hypothetical protein